MARTKKTVSVAAPTEPFNFAMARSELSSVQNAVDTLLSNLTNRERELKSLDDEYLYKVDRLKEVVEFEGEVSSLDDLRLRLVSEMEDAQSKHKAALISLAETADATRKQWLREKEEHDYSWKIAKQRQAEEHAERERALRLREVELELLRSQVEELSEDRKAELQDARLEAASSKDRELRAEFAQERSTLNNRISLLENQLSLKDERIEDLVDEVDRLKTELRDVRTETNTTIREALQASAARSSQPVYVTSSDGVTARK